MLVCERRRFSPVGGAGLVEDVPDVGGDRPNGDDKSIGDLLVGAACRDQTYYVNLPLGEAAGKGRDSRGGQLHLVFKCYNPLNERTHGQLAGNR